MAQQFVLLGFSVLFTTVGGLLLFIGNSVAAAVRESRKEITSIREQLAYRIEQVNLDVAVLTQRFDDHEKNNG